MYNVARTKHSTYGNIIEIIKVEVGEFLDPFKACAQAKKLRKAWMNEEPSKIRILVDNQLLTEALVEKWAREEYHILPKCGECNKILLGEVLTHNLATGLFCSNLCADRNYNYWLDRMNDNEESEFWT